MRRLISFLIACAIVAIALFFSSCSPQTRAARHLEKARRHVEKARILDPTAIKTDTVYKEIPVAVPVVKTDTIFKDVGDTITISKERLSVRYIRDTITNTVQLAAICRADTIIKRVPVKVKETVYIKQSFWRTGAGIAVIIGAILLCIFIAIKLLL